MDRRKRKKNRRERKIVVWKMKMKFLSIWSSVLASYVPYNKFNFFFSQFFILYSRSSSYHLHVTSSSIWTYPFGCRRLLSSLWQIFAHSCGFPSRFIPFLLRVRGRKEEKGKRMELNLKTEIVLSDFLSLVSCSQEVNIGIAGQKEDIKELSTSFSLTHMIF